MGRLLSFTAAAGIVSLEPITGPMARNSGSNTAMDGTEQVFTGVGDIVGLRVEFNAKQKKAAREERGNLIGLGRGANAIRLPIFDPDVITPYEAGLAVDRHLDWQDLPTQPWASGYDWSSGYGWKIAAPRVKVADSTAKDATVIHLQDERWGHSLPFGSWFGFNPSHFGLYCVWEVIGGGSYRIWPPLRKAITYSANDPDCTRATLFPVIVVRPSVNSAFGHRRGLAATEGLSLDLFEIIDPKVRSHFAD